MTLQRFKYAFLSFLAFSSSAMAVELKDSSAKNTLAGKKPPMTIIRSDYQKGEITTLCDAALATLETKLATGTKDVFDFEQHLADHNDAVSPLTFMGYVSENEELRAEGSECEGKNGQLMVDIFTRRALYETIKTSVATTVEQKRLLSETLRGFEKNGMALSDADLQKFKALKSELSTLETQFSANLNGNDLTIELTEAELEGTSANFIGRLKKSADGKYIVTTKSTDYTEVMDNAKVSETRRKMLSAYENRQAVANTKLLTRATEVRRELGQLMGYKTWADYQTNGRMAQNSKAVSDFLGDLKTRLNPRLQSDLQILLNAKKQDDAQATELKAWDIRYYLNQVKKRDYSINDEVIREYFPKDVVMKGMFEIYSTLLGVTYKEVKNASVWSSEVKLYQIRDKKSHQIVGYFYADFVPREGKYGHAAAFPLISGRMLPSGRYSYPVASIVANFTPPANGKPSLLSHDEVETVFHEFGHIMHQTLTRAPYASLSGSNTAQDYVEAPSQMLEAWVWDSEMLEKISGHYLDTSKKLPLDLRQKMIAAKDFGQGYFYSRQITFGLTDLAIHSSNVTLDPNETYRQVHTDVIGIAPAADSHFMASFGHMMGGYDAGYYGYIWSEVYAADMFTAFKSNILDETAGLRYRQTILGQGSMVDPLELITEFLQRAPNNDAFLKKLGL